MHAWPDDRRIAGAAVTFAAMGDRGRVRADHAAYIGVVHRRLREHDLDATLVRVGISGGLRSADLHVLPLPDAPASAEAFLSWNEENGWALGLRRDPATLVVQSPVYKGLSVLPDPEDVATWVVVLLTHPELTPSREDHPFRDHTAEDPQFEAQLAEYAPAG